MNRTTHVLSATEEGAYPATGRDDAVGTLRVSAPVSFGRRHAASVPGDLVWRHPRRIVALSLDGGSVAVGRVDVTIGIGGDAVDGSAAMRVPVDDIHVAAAAPVYLDAHDRPLAHVNIDDHSCGVSPLAKDGAEDLVTCAGGPPRPTPRSSR